MAPATTYGTTSSATVTGPDDEHANTLVELATLTLQNGPKGKTKKAAILHASKETTHALAADASEGGGTVETSTACIQAVIDLEKLSHLAHATDDEFVGGLHREANDHAFNPNDSFERMDSFIGTAQRQQEQPEELSDAVPLIASSDINRSIKTDIPLEINSFADAVMDTEHLGMDDIMEDACTTTMEDNVNVGHDAFLLELPQQKGEKEHHFVLALPERQPNPTDDEEENHFFPILERTISMMSARLPTDIKDVQLQATAVSTGKLGEETLHLDLTIKRQVPAIGYFMLFFGFFALASAGAAFGLQGPRVTASMKTYWRMTSTVLLISPVVLIKLSQDGLPKLSRKEWLLLLAAAFCYAQMTTVFVVSLSLTSLADAFVFSNMTSIILIIGKLCLGLPVEMLQSSGAVLGIAGGIICSLDDAAVGMDGEAYPNALLGKLIALTASFGTAAYLWIARDLRSKTDLFVYMWTLFLLASFFVLGFMIIANEPVEFSRHPDHGLFGWMNLAHDRLALELFMVVVVNTIGTIGYIGVLKYFDPIVVSVIMLMEPVVGVFIGYWVGVDSFPGAQTWIGDIIVIVGSGLVVYSGSNKTESIDVTDAVRPRSNTIDHGKESRSKDQTTNVEMLHTPIMMKRPSRKKRMM